MPLSLVLPVTVLGLGVALMPWVLDSGLPPLAETGLLTVVLSGIFLVTIRYVAPTVSRLLVAHQAALTSANERLAEAVTKCAETHDQEMGRVLQAHGHQIDAINAAHRDTVTSIVNAHAATKAHWETLIRDILHLEQRRRSSGGAT